MEMHERRYLMCRTALRDNNVARNTTHCHAVWIQKLTIVLATCTKVELENTISVKHLTNSYSSV